MPLVPGQADPLDHNSLAYEDKLLLELRIERLKSPRAFSQQPREPLPARAAGARRREARRRGGEFLVRTPFIYTETRGDESQRYAATAWHTLVWSDGAAAHPTEAGGHPELRRRPALDPALPVSTALVTGGSAGIGRAIVERLLDAG